MADRIKYKKKYKESVKPLGIGDPLVGAGLNAGGGRMPQKRALLETTGDKIMGGVTGATLGGIGMGIAGGWQNFGDEMFGKKKKSKVKKVKKAKKRRSY
tara:strand:- start:220 stop:516 length:297 start_codon:yes stop_codon:yes gene_type:complete